MKTIIFILFVALFGQQSFASEQLHNHNHSNETQMQSMEHNSIKEKEYTCPMHPDFVTHDKDESCPICGMNLVEKKQEVLEETKIYRCPMHPHIHNTEKSKCPICGMDLVEDKKESAKAAPSSIPFNNKLTQTLGVTFDTVKKGTLWQMFNTYGVTKINESNTNKYSLYIDGWIKDITEKREGEFVKKGDFLYSVFSPELIDAQYNFLLSFEDNKYSDKKLKYYGISDEVINEIKKSKKIIENIPYYAESDGYIRNLNIRKGQKVTMNEVILETYLNNNSWIEIYIPESKADWVNVNSFFNFEYLNKKYDSVIDVIYPELKNNSIVARATLKSFIPAQSTIELTLFGNPINKAIHIPLQSLLLSEKENIVVVKNNNGRLERRNVKIGKIINDRVIIKEGLYEGEEIVTSGQFLLDSEASLNSGFNNIKG